MHPKSDVNINLAIKEQIVIITGELRFQTIERALKIFKDYLKNININNFNINRCDLSQVTACDSAGLAFCCYLKKTMPDLQFTAVNPLMRQLINLFSLTEIFNNKK